MPDLNSVFMMELSSDSICDSVLMGTEPRTRTQLLCTSLFLLYYIAHAVVKSQPLRYSTSRLSWVKLREYDLNVWKCEQFSKGIQPNSDSCNFSLSLPPPSPLSCPHHDVNLIGDIDVARHHGVRTLSKIEVLKQTFGTEPDVSEAHYAYL